MGPECVSKTLLVISLTDCGSGMMGPLLASTSLCLCLSVSVFVSVSLSLFLSCSPHPPFTTTLSLNPCPPSGSFLPLPSTQLPFHSTFNPSPSLPHFPDSRFKRHTFLQMASLSPSAVICLTSNSLSNLP